MQGTVPVRAKVRFMEFVRFDAAGVLLAKVELNHIYARIGFCPICDAKLMKFIDVGGETKVDV